MFSFRDQSFADKSFTALILQCLRLRRRRDPDREYCRIWTMCNLSPQHLFEPSPLGNSTSASCIENQLDSHCGVTWSRIKTKSKPLKVKKQDVQIKEKTLTWCVGEPRRAKGKSLRFRKRSASQGGRVL